MRDCPWSQNWYVYSTRHLANNLHLSVFIHKDDRKFVENLNESQIPLALEAGVHFGELGENTKNYSRFTYYRNSLSCSRDEVFEKVKNILSKTFIEDGVGVSMALFKELTYITGLQERKYVMDYLGVLLADTLLNGAEEE